ncbi:hypothetical protein [Streptomyces siamensis]|uniref:Uncharacterized protein n=1 Tax=Streptomyces siamensis TaxID=1274986 RepID=A0ABP9IJD6_9ACTN
MNGPDAEGYTLTCTPAGDELREVVRTALDRFIDPDDDTMPALNHVDGGFTWVPAEAVIGDLMKVIDQLLQMYFQAMGDLGRALDKLDSKEQP